MEPTKPKSIAESEQAAQAEKLKKRAASEAANPVVQKHANHPNKSKEPPAVGEAHGTDVVGSQVHPRDPRPREEAPTPEPFSPPKDPPAETDAPVPVTPPTPAQ